MKAPWSDQDTAPKRPVEVQNHRAGTLCFPLENAQLKGESVHPYPCFSPLTETLVWTSLKPICQQRMIRAFVLGANIKVRTQALCFHSVAEKSCSGNGFGGKREEEFVSYDVPRTKMILSFFTVCTLDLKFLRKGL